MKDIGRILQKGNLTPKERVKLLAHNAINKERKGKALLTDADEEAIGNGWRPQNNYEATEFNKYSKAWKTWVQSELDIQTCYLRGQLSFESIKMTLLDFMRFPRINEIKDALTHLKSLRIASEKEAGEIFTLHKSEKLKAGFGLDWLTHKLTLEIIDEKSRKELLELDEEIESNSKWIDEEVIIAPLVKAGDVKALAELVSKAGFDKDGCFNNYACFSLHDIAVYYAKKHNIENITTAILDASVEAKDENETIKNIASFHNLRKLPRTSTAVKEHAEKLGITLEEAIKTTFFEMFNKNSEGLGEPIASSMPELLNKWIETRQEATDTINALISKSILKLSSDGETITGESLYNCKEDYKVIQAFKHYVDEYTAGLEGEGDIYEGGELVISNKEQFYPRNFHRSIEDIETALKTLTTIEEKTIGNKKAINVKGTIPDDLKDVPKKDWLTGYNTHFIDERQSFLKEYGRLLAFYEINKKLSKVFDLDLTYNTLRYLAQLNKNASVFNACLLIALDGGDEKGLENESLVINTDDIKPIDEVSGFYVKEYTDTLGNEF